MAQIKKKSLTPKATPDERAYIRAMRKRSALDLVERGHARVVELADYPLPLKRFLARERTMVHVRLTAVLRRRLEQRSHRSGMLPDQLVREWIRKKLERSAG